MKTSPRRSWMTSSIVLWLLVGVGLVGAAEGKVKEGRPLEELPKDIWNLASVWTEPIKYVAKETRRFDPISGLWFGLLEGSAKSLERTADVLFPSEHEPEVKSGKAILRYSF